jgi:hypothetical protein
MKPFAIIPSTIEYTTNTEIDGAMRSAVGGIAHQPADGLAFVQGCQGCRG